MTSAWVAGTVRSHALAKRRLGRAGARSLARSGSLDDAVALLVAGPYGHDVRPGDSLAAAQQAVGASLLWNLRVLSGWLPRDGAAAVRALAGWFEIAAVDELLRALTGATPESSHPPYRLGALSTAWPKVADATSLPEVRERLARSPWGDPGGERPWEIQLGIRVLWADRVAQFAPPAAGWAAGGAALLVAREVVAARRTLPERLAAPLQRLLGPEAGSAADLRSLASILPITARWAMDGVMGAADLWAAETRFWRRVESDALRLAHSAGFGLRPVLGVVALMAVDAWRVRAALALVARDFTAEVLDAVV